MRSLAACGLLAASALLAGSPAAARDTSEAQMRYRADRAACMEGRTNQDRATCLKEAGAALQEARRGGLATGGDSTLARNSLGRCEKLPAQDRADCVARMERGSTSGSAQQGGILRELRQSAPSR